MSDPAPEPCAARKNASRCDRAIKVSYIVGELEGAGTTVQALTTCHAMAQRGLDVELVVIRRQGALVESPSPDLPVVELRPLPASAAPRAVSRFDVLAAIPRLAAHLRSRGPTVLWSGAKDLNLAALAAGQLASNDTRVVLTITNDIHHRTSEEEPRRKIPSLLIGRFYRHADKVVTLSQAMTDDLIEHEGLPAELIEIIPPPIDLDRIQRLGAEPVDHPWLQPGEPPVVLNVARLAPQKDQPLLLDAFAKAAMQRDLRLIILGEGPDEARLALRRRAEALGVADRVEILEFDPNPYRFMTRAAVFVLSSRWEGFGIVLAESMACGCPVVSTDCRYGPREILREGELGGLVPTHDHEALGTAILREIESPTASAALVERARDYGVETLMQRYDSVLAGITS